MSFDLPALTALQPDEILTGYALDTPQGDRIADLMFPRATPGPSSVSLLDWGAQGLKPLAGTLVTGQTNQLAAFSIDLPTKQTLEVENHAFKIPINTFEEAKAAEVASGQLDLEGDSVTIATNQWLTTKEQFGANILGSSAVFDGANSTTLSGGNMWSDPNSDPQADFLAKKEAVALATGVIPNKTQMSLSALNTLRQHPKIKAQLPSTQQGLASKDQMCAIFEVDEIRISTAILNSAPSGSVDSLAWLWPNDEVILFYEAPVISRGIRTFAANFPWARFPNMGIYRYPATNPIIRDVYFVETMRYVVIDRMCAFKWKGVI